MSEFTAMKDGYNVGTRDGWIDALDYVIETLNDEIDYQEQRGDKSDESIPILYRLNMIFSSRSKEWMLSGN